MKNNDFGMTLQSVPALCHLNNVCNYLWARKDEGLGEIIDSDI